MAAFSCVQAAILNWGNQKMSAFDMFNSLMSFQALAGQQPAHSALSNRTTSGPANSAGEIASIAGVGC